MFDQSQDLTAGHDGDLMNPPRVFLGCAGWTIPSAQAAAFPGQGAHLERYARRFNAVEINSSFYRSHKPATYARWAATVPEGFRFAVKVPRQVTHTSRLRDWPALERFLDDIRPLGDALGPLLIQLPPTFTFDPGTVSEFVSVLDQRFHGVAVCEPRHRSWFTREAREVLERCRVARVAAHPAAVPEGEWPGGWGGLAYYRLHGAPQWYHSSYPDAFLQSLGKQVLRAARSVPTWCIFDNTASGAATINALTLMMRLGRRPGGLASRQTVE